MSKNYSPTELKPMTLPERSSLNQDLLQSVTVDEGIQQVWDFLSQSEINALKHSPKEIIQLISREIEQKVTEKANIAIFISCNWYDKGKAPLVYELAARFPSITIILSGGRAERLTSKRSESLGGEPFEMREHLLDYAKSINEEPIKLSRIVIYNGGRVTTHNIDFLLNYCKQVNEFEKKKTHIIVIEESYLSKRVSATLIGRLQSSNTNDIISFTTIPSGSRDFKQLSSLHNNLDILSLFWIIGEVDRLNSYSKPNGNQLFTELMAFGTTSNEGIINKVVSLLKEHYKFNYITEVVLKDRDMILRICSPNYGT